MPTQHSFLPQHLALAIALALGCADVSMAQSAAADASAIETTAQMQARLKAFTAASDTKRDTIDKIQETVLLKGDDNDLIILNGNGKLIGLTDGGGGANVLQLDTAKGGALGETRNVQDLYIKRSEWSSDGTFAGNSLIDTKAKWVNTGSVGGAVHVLGKLVNKGTVAGPVIVGRKGSFSGGGTVNSLDVAGLLEVSPQMGAPSVTHNLKFSPSATLAYGLDDEGRGATIKVGGTATLDNATLRIVAVPVENIETRTNVLIKAKQVVGEFKTIDNKLIYLNATADYSSGTQVGLSFERNKVPLKEGATSRNGRIFINAVEDPSLPIPAPPELVVDAVPKQPQVAPKPPTIHPAPKPTEKVQAVAVVTPTVIPSTPTIPPTSHPTLKPTEPTTVASTKPKPTASAQAIKPASKPNAAITALLGTNLTTAADAIDQLSGYDTADLGNATLSSVAPITAGLLSAMGRKTSAGGQDNGQVWIQAVGHNGRLAKQLGSYAMKHSTKGLMLGTDWAVTPDWRLGIIGGKTQTRLDSHQFEGALDSWLAGAYALRQDGPLALRLGAVYGSHDGSTKRHVAFNRFRDNLKGRYEAHTQQIFSQVGYQLNLGHFDIEPYAQLGYQHYERGRYSEKGGDGAVQYNAQAQDHYSTDLGLRLARPFMFDQGVALTPRLDVGWRHLYGDIRGDSQQRLISGGNTYRIEGVELDRDSVLVQAGLDLAVSPRHILGLSYSDETGQDNRSGSLMGQWRMTF
jgi:subtilase-type serine protease